MNTDTAPTSSATDSAAPPGRVLVIGSTGKTGRRVAERLQHRGIAVRPGSRSAEVPYDWEDPSTWEPALTGVDAAYVSYVPDLAAAGSVEAITRFTETVQRAEVSRLVLLSGRGEVDAQRCEQVMIDSGLDVTVLRANWFLQNFDEGFFTDELRAGVLALPVDQVPEPFVDVEDIADVAVASLTDDRHIGQTYELSGPEAHTFAEAVAAIATATDRDIRYVPIELDAYVAGAREQGVDEELIMLMQYLFGTVLDGRNSSPTDDVQKILGRPPRSLRRFAERAAATGVWAANPEQS